MLARLCRRSLWLLLLGVVGCGYHPEGRPPLAAERPSLAVDLLLNRTGRAFLENEVSNRVMERFARGARYRLTEAAPQASLLLTGAVTRYETTPSAYDRTDRIVLYRAGMTIQVVVTQPADGRVVWRGDVSESVEFAASDDRALQQANENAAVARLAERLADELYARVATGF